jgi:hypothetical protein
VGNRGRLPSIWLARTIMLAFPMQGPVLDGIWVLTDWVWSKTFHFVACAKRILILELSWLETTGNFPVFLLG